MAEPNGLGLPGGVRLERIEMQQERLGMEMRDLTQQATRALQEIREVRHDNIDVLRRLRSLELRFYGILAGLIAGFAGILWSRGGV